MSCAVAAIGCEEEWYWEGEVCWYAGFKRGSSVVRCVAHMLRLELNFDPDAMLESHNDDKSAEQNLVQYPDIYKAWY